MTDKNEMIKILRDNGFNCFPIPRYPESEPEQKKADSRYKASRTVHNQIIKENENYGYIPIMGSGSAIVDLDDKERYRTFAENMINDGYMVIESPCGWHIPVTGLSGNISKTELFDYDFQPNKKIIEIQGPDHFCIGPYSIIWNKETKFTTQVKYENKGTDKIWDAKNIDFHQFVDDICKNCNVEARRKKSTSSYKNLRDRFLQVLPPTKGMSNDYFFQAAIQCNTDGLTQNEALEKIKTVYTKWEQTDAFSDRPWSNIEYTVSEVYQKNLKIETGRPKGSSKGIDRTEIAKQMIADRLLYSNVETHEISENTNGFLEKINDSLKRELVSKYPEMEQSDYHSILFKLEALAQPIPPTNKTLFVFNNGAYDRTARMLIETKDIADMGFKNYNYLESTKENEPTKFIEIMFGNVPESEHARIKAGLRSILLGYLDPRISVIQGDSRVGKSTGLLILVVILGEYAMAVELGQLLGDRFIRAKIKGKRLLVLQDLPDAWKDFSQIKTMTGEQQKTERGFMQDSSMFENKLKIWASGNYLAKIPEKEKNAMYSSRLSLVHNIRKEPYLEDPTLIERVVKEEGEKIVSWILNLPDEECQYEDSKTVRKEWEKLASPEIEYLENNWKIKEDSKISIMTIKRDFEVKYNQAISLDQMKKALEEQGFIEHKNMIQNIVAKPKNDTIV